MAEDERRDDAAEQSETVDEQPTETAAEAGAETPEAGETPEQAAAESAESAEQAAEASPDDAAEQAAEASPDESAESDAPAAGTEEPASAPADDDAVQDQADAGEAVPAAEEKKRDEKKADAIPGADLEPIAVDDDEQLSAEERARREADEEERARREAAFASDTQEEEQVKSRAPARLEGDARFLATGKRKRSIARVILLPGSGKIEVNKRPLEEFFPRPLHQTIARQPLTITGYEGNVDVRVRVHGGGVSGQAGAVRHGIARALMEIDPELRGELKRRGFLTRDARVKERRKAGLKKARKRPQFSKR
jgi:small subunit ribosomal protein S9